MPFKDVEADRNVGGVPSTVELLVTEMLLRDIASLPSASCTAALSSELEGSL